jgi:hypothetical protein
MFWVGVAVYGTFAITGIAVMVVGLVDRIAT